MAVKQPRGFAAMDPEQRRAIASLGGQAAHDRGQTHKFTSAEARQAGKKGGWVVSQDRKRMARIGRKGGNAKRRKRVKEEKGKT